MKRRISFSVVLFVLACNVNAQAKIDKPAIDSTAIANWTDLANPVINNDGNYIMYNIRNMPRGGNTVVIQSTVDAWRKEFSNAEAYFFSPDNKTAFLKMKDSFFVVTLGTKKVEYVSNVLSFSSFSRDFPWFAYIKKTQQGNKLVIRNLYNNREQYYSDVVEYQLHKNGNDLILITREGINEIETIKWIDLKNNRTTIIWSSSNNSTASASHFNFDDNGNQLSFIVTEANQLENSVWYYKRETAKAVKKIGNTNPVIKQGYVLSKTTPWFNKTGNFVFFNIQKKPAAPADKLPNSVQVDVWNYKDMILQPNQEKDLFNPADILTASISVQNNNALLLYDRSKFPGSTALYTDLPNDFVIDCEQKFTGDEVWNRALRNYFLVNLVTGERKKIWSGFLGRIIYSEKGDWLIFPSFDKRGYYSYNIYSEQIHNLSEGISAPLGYNLSKNSRFQGPIYGLAGWLDDDKIMVYDNYDIWSLDINAIKPPVNLTNGYGRAHNIKFRIAPIDETSRRFSSKHQLLLCAFNTSNKNNGFFLIDPNKTTDPVPLSMSPYLLYVAPSQTNVGATMLPVKALNRNKWIVQSESSTDAPNYFVTEDFKEFKQLTFNQPQAKYNWLSTQLITWKQFDGQPNQGILYKPENFDSTKKYPLIVTYYEGRSDELNEFLYADFMHSSLPIPWFVSHGYLVFVPDVFFMAGKPGESIINSVVSGTKALYKYAFIDSTRIAIEGHSFGGYETNYLVTHTNIFAAANEGAGSSDFISFYGSLPHRDFIGESHVNYFELDGQYYLESTFWDSLQTYIYNSPLFSVPKVSTPLLMMHNKEDEMVPWQQAIEFFLALRRLNKPVWMLQYDKGGHGVNGLKDKKDYTTRVQQFFDHYLKGSPAPKWLTQGIPAKLKGVITGYEFDPSGNCGKDCLVCKMWNEKMKKDSVGTMKEIRERAKSDHWMTQ